MGGETPETCWAVNKRHDNKLENCCIWLVIYLKSSKIYGNTLKRAKIFMGNQLLQLSYNKPNYFPATNYVNRKQYQQPTNTYKILYSRPCWRVTTWSEHIVCCLWAMQEDFLTRKSSPCFPISRLSIKRPVNREFLVPCWYHCYHLTYYPLHFMTLLNWAPHCLVVQHRTVE